MRQRTCAHCGQPFTPKSSNQKYCNPDCYYQASKSRKAKDYHQRKKPPSPIPRRDPENLLNLQKAPPTGRDVVLRQQLLPRVLQRTGPELGEPRESTSSTKAGTSNAP